MSPPPESDKDITKVRRSLVHTQWSSGLLFRTVTLTFPRKTGVVTNYAKYKNMIVYFNLRHGNGASSDFPQDLCFASFSSRSMILPAEDSFIVVPFGILGNFRGRINARSLRSMVGCWFLWAAILCWCLRIVNWTSAGKKADYLDSQDQSCPKEPNPPNHKKIVYQ